MEVCPLGNPNVSNSRVARSTRAAATQSPSRTTTTREQRQEVLVSRLRLLDATRTVYELLRHGSSALRSMACDANDDLHYQLFVTSADP